LDFIGLNEYENIKVEDYLKYDEMIVMSNFLETNIYETGEPFCDVTIKLSDNVRYERRVYTKLITILGDVGGLMEVVFTLFRILCSFPVDILYDISLVNNIFNFDIEKELVLNKKKEKKEDIKADDVLKKIKFSNSNKFISRNIIMSDEYLTGTLSGMATTSDKRINEVQRKTEEEEINRYNLYNLKTENYLKNINSLKSNNQNNLNSNRKLKLTKLNLRNKRRSKTINKIQMKDKNKNNNAPKIMDKIKLNRACIYCCFLCARKRKNLENILLDEGINIICEKLDLINLFQKISKIDNIENIQEKVGDNNIYSIMSNECKENLLSLKKK